MTSTIAAVLFDRDGTLIADHPYDPDPAHVVLMPHACAAVGELRAAGKKLGVVSNQPGISWGLISGADVRRVNQRADALLGGLDVWEFCPHEPEGGCDCRKPRPGLIRRAAERLGVPTSACAVVGDTGADIEAALAAGAQAVLVPNAVTRQEEVASAPLVASDLWEAVELLLARQPSKGLVSEL